MRVHYLQHVPFEGLGYIGHRLETAGCRITGTRLFESRAFPDQRGIDLLVVLGGPMSVNDEAEFSWLAAEKRYVRDAVESGMPVLGICLGAQLIASALGARVHRNPEREIGWFPVQGVPAGRPGLAFPPAFDAFHWHGETFDLPPGAVRLARTGACENQAFQLGDAVLGLQFHLEATPESVREIVANCRDELIPSRYVQSEEEILADAGERCRSVNRLMGGTLAFLLPGLFPRG